MAQEDLSNQSAARQASDISHLIVAQFTDSTGRQRTTSPATRTALLKAMGGFEPNSTTRVDQPALILHAGTSTPSPGAGRLVLEDETALAVEHTFSQDLPLGYHRWYQNDDDQWRPVIVCPRHCFLPDPLCMWGWAIQLYSVRSQRSWGIGDLADLRHFGHWASELGAGLILLGPLNAVAPVVPQEPSPYFPSSRRYRHPIYLRVEEVPGATSLGDELERVACEANALNDDRLINRDAIFQQKITALEKIWSRGVEDRAFEAYCKQQGEPLRHFAVYCVLAEQFGGDWHAWPAHFQNHTSPAVARYAEQFADRVRFHEWLQWLLDRQLEQAATACPLVHDLPIGFDPKGFDAWTWKELLAVDVTMGAPPDDFNPRGQDWGLPPFAPHKLRAVAYEPFVQTLRAAFRHAAGLRIDHVMGLFRQFWIPRGSDPAAGAYVTFPADELLAILALESRRAGAWVVGEDLGTAPEGMRPKLAAHNILSYRLLWFENDPPARYPARAVAAVTTHDLPTVAGLWSGADLAELDALGLESSRTGLDEIRRRFIRLTGLTSGKRVTDAVEQAYRLLGQSPSAVLLATLEDALAVEQRPNVPGTMTERPNWSLALPKLLEEMVSLQLPRKIAEMLQRPGGQ